MKHLATALGLSLLLLVGAAAAEETALERLSALSGYDEGLARTVRAGIYMGTKRIGSMTSTLSKAPGDSGAVYLNKTVMKMALGPEEMSEEITLLLNADLSLVSETKISSEVGESGEKVSTTTVTLKDGTWIRTEVNAGKEEVQTAPKKGPNYGPCLFPVASKLAGVPGKHTLPGITWSEGASNSVELKLEISKVAEHPHRGKTVSGVKIEAKGLSDGAVTLIMTPKGRLLSLTPGDAPLRFVAGTKEECAKDLPAAGGAADAAVMKSVKVYFYVLAGEAPLAKLDTVMDWKAIHAAMSKSNPKVGSLTPEVFAETFKTKIKAGIPALPKSQADMVLGMLTPKIEGETAKVPLPGKEAAFELAKGADGIWRITAFPH